MVDDETFIQDIVSRWLHQENYKCITASSGDQALEIMENQKISLVISDIMMPGISGIDLLEHISDQYPDTAVIMLTGVDDRETATKAVELGAYGYLIKPVEKNEILINVAGSLRRRELEIMRTQYEDELEKKVQERTQELQTVQNVTIFGMAVLAEYRDSETGGHIMRTQHYVKAICERLSLYPKFSAELAAETIDLFYKSTPLHDIGKVAVPDAILLKPGKLTKDEFEIMKQHTIYGSDAIKRAEEVLGVDKNTSFLRIARDITATHHEKWDGSGYPAGLKGEEIPLVGRLMAIFDVYDALISKRVYKDPIPHSKAVRIITHGDGRVMPEHFDPDILDVFNEMHQDFREIAYELADHEEERAGLRKN
ncbi:MAG: response regulator [Thermodesulfobacteriota bacterium]